MAPVGQASRHDMQATPRMARQEAAMAATGLAGGSGDGPPPPNRILRRPGRGEAFDAMAAPFTPAPAAR
jgi:hypothetical protein